MGDPDNFGLTGLPSALGMPVPATCANGMFLLV